jgi:hypothetical protein
MKYTLLLAACMFIAACASTETTITGAPRAVAAAGGSGNTYYCWKEKLDTEGGNLVCNWEANAADACNSTGVMSIAKSRIAKGPDNTRRCENGQWLVVVTMK